MHIELLPIRENGEITGLDDGGRAAVEPVIPMTVENYRRTGYAEPWIGYVATIDGEAVGVCAYKTAPVNGRVEIAYHTFPRFEGKGIATEMAHMLVARAIETDPALTVFAQTLPEENASTHILQKNGFVKTAEVVHPEDGPVFEWEYRG